MLLGGVLDVVVDGRVAVLRSLLDTEYNISLRVFYYFLSFFFVVSLAFWFFFFLYKKTFAFFGYSSFLLDWLFAICFFIYCASLNSIIFQLSSYSVITEGLWRVDWVALLGTVFFFICILVCIRAYGVFRWGLVGVAVFSALSVAVDDFRRNGDVGGKNNIIIIGVDSMSSAVIEAYPEYFPNIKDLLDGGVRYSQAYTELGRTYPAWVTILSGRPVAENNAFFNLRDMDVSVSDDLVTELLSNNGYYNLFAIDERRFNNIDERFGFDKVVGPIAGVMDFLLQHYTDSPITNIALQSRYSYYLFPWTWINVASYVNYSSDGFIDEITRALRKEDSLFLVVHFESGHYPYRSRHADLKFEHENIFWEKYVKALNVVDVQVGKLFSSLRDKGVLDDALVVVLSDHGESMGQLEAAIEINGDNWNVLSYGHGTSLLSELQNRIILGFVQYKDGRLVPLEKKTEGLVSLLDVKPVVEGYATSGNVVLPKAKDCLMVETGIRFVNSENYNNLDEVDLAVESASYYRIDEMGSLRVREERMAELVNNKDVGYRCLDRMTWYSARRGEFYSVVLDEKGLPAWQVDLDLDAVKKIEHYRASLRRGRDN